VISVIVKKLPFMFFFVFDIRAEEFLVTSYINAFWLICLSHQLFHVDISRVDCRKVLSRLFGDFEFLVSKGSGESPLSYEMGEISLIVIITHVIN